MAPAAFCESYPDAPACQGTVDCTMCHTTPPARNLYGASLEANLLPSVPRPLSDEDFLAGLPAALAAVANADSDGDGYTNEEEIVDGSLPADVLSQPTVRACDGDGCPTPQLDPAYWYRKVLWDFCGTPTTFDQETAIRADQDAYRTIHETLDTCLDSEYWQGHDGALFRIAHPKIRPSSSIKSGANAGSVPLANYDDDYALFVWTQIDHHDVRDVLTAQYLVRTLRDETTDHVRYEPYQASASEDIQARGFDEAQLVDVPRRAGLLTSRWNLALNTMFTALPRTTAAQAYRAFLGLDIAKMEGLADVQGEPVDYDQKGVQAPACARCHSTLDPLTYPFSRYSGFTGGLPFSYVPDRPAKLAQDLQDPLRRMPETGVIFGRQVSDLLEWAEVAANSDAFAQQTVLDYWRLLFRERPRPSEQADFTTLWRALMTDDAYSVERMLHRLIDTEAYRAY